MKSGQQKSHHILLPFDCDFGVHSIKEIYKKIDKFITFFNKYNFDNIVMEYSTTRNYVKAVHDEVYSWPVLTDQVFNISYELTYGPKTQSTLGDFNSEIMRHVTLAN
jgi:hypothetical protein